MPDRTIESLSEKEREAIEYHLEWLEGELGGRTAAEDLATRVLIKMGPQQSNEKIHYCPTTGAAACGMVTKSVTDNPAIVSCKRCVSALMPWARQAWNEANS